MGKKTKKGQKTQDAATLIYPPFLYLGPCSAASSSFLHSNGITHVLSIGATPAAHLESVTYERLSLTDSPSSPIAKVSDAANPIITAASASHNGNGKILVHCSAAVSRSPTIVVAYLMKVHQMSLRDALGRVVRARPTVSPNPGFLRQLKEMETGLFGSCSLDVEDLPRRREERESLFKEASLE